MKAFIKKDIVLFILYAIVVSYLLINTGIISDDFDAMSRTKPKDFKALLIPKGNFYFIETPVQYFAQYIWYHFFQLDNSLVDSVCKIFYIILSFYLISRFFGVYLSAHNALWVSFLFIFFPSHDSTVYSFMLQYLTLSFAFYLYAFYLAHRNRPFLALMFALLASFVSYGSPVIAVSLFLLFVLHRELKKGLLLLIPNIIYVCYYILVSKILAVGTDKTLAGISISSFIKHFILQVLTFIDASIGPSMWLKIYYSFSELTFLSVILGAALIIILNLGYHKKTEKYNPKLLLCFTVLAFLSFAMFAVTGRYPQFAFNLGNRVTIFGSLLLAYLVGLIFQGRILGILIFSVMIFTTLGISDHWKGWNAHQQIVISNMRNNRDLKNYSDTKMVFVSGNQYSKYGPISHIEFLSETWVPACIFRLLFKKDVPTESLSKNLKYIDGYLIDRRYDAKIRVGGYINVYDSENNVFLKLKDTEINRYIDSLPQENRHWIQLYNVKFLKDIVSKLMPRLRYAL